MVLSAVRGRYDRQTDQPDQRNAIGPWQHVPPAPRTVVESGLPLGLLKDLVLKVLRTRDHPTLADLKRTVCLHQQLCEEVIDGLVRRKLVTVNAADSLLRASFRFGLSDEGKLHADDAIRRCAYVGAAPLPIDQYSAVVHAQQAQRARPHATHVRQALAHLVLPEATVEAVGQAFASGRPLMVYGPSGTGKTDIVVSIANALEGSVVVPHALYAQGHIIEVLDAHLHVSRLNPELEHADVDRRWREIRRPVVLAGGEMSAEALELTYDGVRNVHVAPLTVRAQGGVLIIDDLGRQRTSLASILNRWIQLMENGADTFSLQSSEVFTLPLDITLVFSTNLQFEDLMDEAYLRRITYKIPVRTPDRREFLEIARRACEAIELPYDEHAISYLGSRLYDGSNIEPKSCYARDLVQTVFDTALYRGIQPQLSRELIDWAIELYIGERARQQEPGPARRPASGGRQAKVE
jgi:predicted ATPase with chaperone activity